MFGVNCMEADAVDGAKRIDKTMRYVHFTEAHMRPLPERSGGTAGHDDPDQKSIAILDARRPCWTDSRDGHGNQQAITDKNQEVLVS